MLAQKRDSDSITFVSLPDANGQQITLTYIVDAETLRL